MRVQVRLTGLKIWDCLTDGNIVQNEQMLALAFYIAAVTKRIGTALLRFDEGDLDVCTVKYNIIKSSTCFLLHSPFAFVVNLPPSMSNLSVGDPRQRNADITRCELPYRFGFQ